MLDDKFEKVMSICFPRLSEKSKAALALALTEDCSMSLAARVHGVSPQSVAKNVAKYKQKYQAICKAEEMLGGDLC